MSEISVESTLPEGGSAADVSDVFAKADEFFAGQPEGVLYRDEVEVAKHFAGPNEDGSEAEPEVVTDETVAEPRDSDGGGADPAAPNVEAPVPAKKAAAKKTAKKAPAKKAAAKKTTTKKAAATKATAKSASKP